MRRSLDELRPTLTPAAPAGPRQATGRRYRAPRARRCCPGRGDAPSVARI